MPTLASAIDAVLEGTVVGSFTRIGPAVRARLDDWRPIEEYDLTGRTLLVTGANSGLGLATARALARTGATLHVTVRSQEKADDTVAAIRDEVPGADVTAHIVDLTDLDALRTVATEIREAAPTLDGLVHNAGAMFSQRREVDGIETTTLLHVVAPMLLTHELLPSLRASDHPGRVVFVTSGGMYTEKLDVDTLQSPDDYAPASAYARAKRAQVVLTAELDQRLPDVVVHAMHPGWAATPGVSKSLPVFDRVMGPLLREPADGADTTAWLLADEAGGRDGGQLWLDRRPRSDVRLPGTATAPREAARLWDEVLRLAGLPADAVAASTTA